MRLKVISSTMLLLGLLTTAHAADATTGATNTNRRPTRMTQEVATATPEMKNPQGAYLYCGALTHDFGVVERKNGDIEHTFVIENRGTEPLVIVRVARSCSCMKASISRKPLEVGERREMRVVYEVRKMPPGLFSKVVQIYSNSEGEGMTQFSITGRSSYTPRRSK